MPYSAKQLDQRYKDVCSNIEDAREYTLKNLKSVVSMNLDTFFKVLHKQDLKQCEKELETIEEVLRQCRVAVKNEKSRRSLQDDIGRLTQKQEEKATLKETFIKKRRIDRLIKATPYNVNTGNTIGHETDLLVHIYIEDNTWFRGDMKFIFSCSNPISHSFAALTRELSI